MEVLNLQKRFHRAAGNIGRGGIWAWPPSRPRLFSHLKKLIQLALSPFIPSVAPSTSRYPSYQDEQFNQTVLQCEAINKEDTDICFHALWSNECFELWFVLHYAYQQTGISRDQYIRKLDEYLESYGGYSKTRDDMYSILFPKLRIAIKNAKKLRQNNEGKTPAISNPGTVVYEIIEYLCPYLERLSD